MVRSWKATALGTGAARGGQKAGAFSYCSTLNREASQLEDGQDERLARFGSAAFVRCPRPVTSINTLGSPAVLLPTMATAGFGHLGSAAARSLLGLRMPRPGVP